MTLKNNIQGVKVRKEYGTCKRTVSVGLFKKSYRQLRQVYQSSKEAVSELIAI